MSNISEKKNEWVNSSNGNAPSETVVGGHDQNGEPIYVARASHNGDLIPGKLIASQLCTFISWGGKEYKKYDYEVLVRGSNNWVRASVSDIPSDALPGGRTVAGETLYIGRVNHNGSIMTGKVQTSHGVCYIPFDGKELRFYDYEVLTYYTVTRHRPHSKFSSVLTATTLSAHVLYIFTVVKLFISFVMPPVPNEKNKWVQSSNGNAPAGTLVGGHAINGEPIYVARASHNGDLIPGKLIASHFCTYVSWGGLEFKKYDYEVLVGGSNNWIATKTYHVPSDALPGGKTDIGDTLYIGRVNINKTITTGKVHQELGVCYIPFEGKELLFYDYEVLIT